VCLHVHYSDPRMSTSQKKRKSPSPYSKERTAVVTDLTVMEPIGQIATSIQNAAAEISFDELIIPKDIAILIAGYYEEDVILGKRAGSPDLWNYIFIHLFNTSTALSYQLDWEAYLVGPEHVFFLKRWTNYGGGQLQLLKLHGNWLLSHGNVYFQQNEVQHFRGVHVANKRDMFVERLVALCKECSLFFVPVSVCDSSISTSFEWRVNPSGVLIPRKPNSQCQHVVSEYAGRSANYCQMLCKSLFK
jgi:hypothetical protein